MIYLSTLRVQFRPVLGGDWGEVKIQPQNHFHLKQNLTFVQVDVGASSEGGEVWGGSAQLLGLRPSTQYEVIFLVLLDVGTVD